MITAIKWKYLSGNGAAAWGLLIAAFHQRKSREMEAKVSKLAGQDRVCAYACMCLFKLPKQRNKIVTIPILMLPRLRVELPFPLFAFILSKTLTKEHKSIWLNAFTLQEEGSLLWKHTIQMRPGVHWRLWSGFQPPADWSFPRFTSLTTVCYKRLYNRLQHHSTFKSISPEEWMAPFVMYVKCQEICFTAHSLQPLQLSVFF